MANKYRKKMFNTFGHQGNTNQNYTESSSHHNKMARKQKATNIGEDFRGYGGERNPLYYWGNVN
jgi:hypothetical protein